MKIVAEHEDGSIDKFIIDNTDKKHKVWKIIITKDENNIFTYHPMIEVEIDDKSYNKFQWDRLVRIDYVDTEDVKKDKVILLASDKQRMVDVSTGMWVEYDLRNNWLKNFNEDRRAKMRQEIKTMEGEDASSKV